MRKSLGILSFLSLLLPILSAEDLNLSQQLKKNLSGKGPFVVLGLVSDSEQNSTITEEGNSLRKKLEQAIQNSGGEITPLSRSERMKLERQWSLPFTGRINDELKAEIKVLKSGLVTGSFSPHEKDDLMLLVILPDNDRTLVFHENRPVLYKTTAPDVKVEVKSIPSKEVLSHGESEAETEKPSTIPHKEPPKTQPSSEPLAGLFSLGGQLKTSRTIPKETRRTRKLLKSEKLDHLRMELMGNQVLKEYVSERKNLNDDQKLAVCQKLIESAQNTLLTASKIEFLRRAFILNASRISPLPEIEKHTLDRLLEHREFFHETSNLD